MQRRIPIFCIFLLVSLTLHGCLSTEQIAPPIGLSMQTLAETEGYSITQLRRGRNLYITDCATCHSPEPVARYSQRQWDEIMPRMARETKMSLDDEQAVTAYVRFILQYPPDSSSQN